MKRDDDPRGWVPDLVPIEDPAERARTHARAYRRRKKREEKTASRAEKIIIDEKRLARNKAARERYAAKIAGRPPKRVRKPRAETVEPKPRLGRPRPKTSTRPGPHYIAITVRAWRRMLTLILIREGYTKTRDISGALGTDPTSIAQAICELKRLGLMPSQNGRTPIASRAQPKR